MQCPKCGSEIKENQKYCSQCGAKIEILDDEQLKKKIENQKLIIIVLLVLIGSFILISLLLKYVGIYTNSGISSIDSHINTEQTIPSDEEETVKSEPCDSDIVTQFVIDAFKKTNIYYNAINLNSIASVDIQNIITGNYDSLQDSYQCKAQVVMKANKAFIPKSYDSKNEYYYYSNETNDIDEYTVEGIHKYTKYVFPIEYNSQSVNNETLVSFPQNANKENGDFSCIGNCDDRDSFIINPDEEKRIEIEKKHKLEEIEKQQELERQKELQRQKEIQQQMEIQRQLELQRQKEIEKQYQELDLDLNSNTNQNEASIQKYKNSNEENYQHSDFDNIQDSNEENTTITE